MEINNESFDKKVKVVMNALKGKDPVIQLTASLCFALLKYEIFDQEEPEKKEEEKREEKTEEKEPETVDFPIALNGVLYGCKKAKRRGWNGERSVYRERRSKIPRNGWQRISFRRGSHRVPWDVRSPGRLAGQPGRHAGT